MDLTDKSILRDFVFSMLDIPDFMLVLLDREFKIAGCNPRFLSVTDEIYSNVINRNFLSFSQEKKLPFSSQNLDENILNKHHVNIQAVNGKHIEWYVNAIKDAESIIVGYVVAGMDVTRLKLAQYNERKAHAYLQNIIDTVPGYIFWKDTESVFLGCNQLFAKSAGLNNPGEIIGKTDFDLPWKKSESEAYVTADKKIIHSRQPRLNIEEVQTLRDGVIVNLLTSKVPFYNEENEIEGVLAVYTNITELKKMEEKLLSAKKTAEIANQAKSEFIANMSHDIRTPLTGTLGLMQELINVADDIQASLEQPSISKEDCLSLLRKMTGKVRENCRLLSSSTDELLQLLNEILETMRLESGENPGIESFDLHALVRHNIELMQPVAHHNNLELLCEIDERIPAYLNGLRNYLDRTLLNLLSNALKFTEKGFVKIRLELLEENHSTYHPGDKIVLKILVQDSGIGIPTDKFEMIFENFSRLMPSWQGLYKGAGLGLYTVKRYIEAMQAEIKVESELGKGSSFIIKLPLTVSDHSDRKEVACKSIEVNKNQSINSGIISGTRQNEDTDTFLSILIVEDNLLAAKSVQVNLRFLSKACHSHIVENGMRAIKQVQEQDYDLILMDIGLPDLDGIEVTRRIRALNHKVSNVPIIALTGHGCDPEVREKAIAAGMQDVFAKPIEIPKLEAAVQQYVAIAN